MLIRIFYNADKVLQSLMRSLSTGAFLAQGTPTELWFLEALKRPQGV